MRRLWITVGAVATVVAIGWVSFSAVMLLGHEEVTEAETFEAADITAVDVHTDNGTIEVVGGDGDEVSVQAEISHGLWHTDHRAEVEGATLVVRSDCRLALSYWCRTHYRLVVPRELVVAVDTGNGRVTVSDIVGDVEVDSGNGRIELIRLAGTVDATSRNGRVQGGGLRSDAVTAISRNGAVRLSFAEAPGRVSARSRNGAVEVVVPDGAATYRVETDTDNGSVDAAIRTDPSSARSIVATTANGSVRVRYPSG